MKKEPLKFDVTKDQEYELACNRCANETYHKVLASVQKNESDEYTYYYQDYEIVLCMGCREVSFRSNWVFSEDIDFDPESGFPYPKNHEDVFPNRITGRKELKDYSLLPYEVLKIYKETYIALSNRAPILTGVGIRALVESICKEKNAKGKDLEAKIDSLVTLGILTVDGAEILHSTRLMGNKAVHELTASSDEELNTALNLVEHLLMGVYILPKSAELLPKRVKKTSKAT
ncbi:MAG: DUF4145 domain-containing protein [Vampirovibrionia bacterium]